MARLSRLVLIIALIDVGLAFVVLVLLGIAVDSNWTSFVPDLIVGIVPAGIVGGALLLYQRRAEHLERQRRASWAWTSVRRSLVDVLPEINVATARGSFESPSDRFLKFLTHLDSVPANEWAELLVSTEIDHALKLATQVRILEAEGSDLESMLATGLSNDERRRRARRKLLQLPHENSSAPQRLGRAETQLQSEVDAFLAEGPVARLGSSYLQRLRDVEESTEALRIELATADYAHLTT